MNQGLEEKPLPTEKLKLSLLPVDYEKLLKYILLICILNNLNDMLTLIIIDIRGKDDR